MILKPKPVSVRQLHWDPALRQYIGEISSTHGFGRVYDDACDEGLTLVGRSGAEIPFVVEHTERDDDGDILFWLLRAADPATARSINATIHLFND